MGLQQRTPALAADRPVPIVNNRALLVDGRLLADERLLVGIAPTLQGDEAMLKNRLVWSLGRKSRQPKGALKVVCASAVPRFSAANTGGSHSETSACAGR